jgi:hypothetical protein
LKKICKQSVRINGVFFPGGDPGDNPPELSYAAIAGSRDILKKYHPQASTWVSLQGFYACTKSVCVQIHQDKMPYGLAA